MPPNKDRLYVALYARAGNATMPDGEDEYTWGLLVGPKLEIENGKGTRYHAKERMTVAGKSEWYFDESDVTLLATSMLLVRIMIGKVERIDRLVANLRSVPIRQGVPGWNCVKWVKEALEALGTDGYALGTSMTEWEAVRDGVMWYVRTKKAEGRWDEEGNSNMKYAATYDLLSGRETIP